MRGRGLELGRCRAGELPRPQAAHVSIVWTSAFLRPVSTGRGRTRAHKSHAAALRPECCQLPYSPPKRAFQGISTASCGLAETCSEPHV